MTVKRTLPVWPNRRGKFRQTTLNIEQLKPFNYNREVTPRGCLWHDRTTAPVPKMVQPTGGMPENTASDRPVGSIEAK
jgi:hypothetical protein